MKALTLTAVNQPLELLDQPAPEPAPGEAVVRLHAAGLNRRDYWISVGQYPGVRTPVVPGSDGAGVVTRVGDGVDDLLPGRDVVINPGFDWGSDESAQSTEFTILGMPRDGTFAEEVAVPVAQLHDRPAHLDWTAAAALPLAGVTAYRALFTQGGLQPGQHVLITGIGGGVATCALLFAAAAGAHVWITSSSDAKIKRAVDLGAAGGFNYRESDWLAACTRAAPPIDVIIDGAGGPGYRDLLKLAASGGRIVSYGATAGPIESIDPFRLFWKQLRLQGSTMGSPADFRGMLAFVTRHAIQPVVSDTFTLSEGNEAIRAMASSPQFGNLVLKIA